MDENRECTAHMLVGETSVECGKVTERPDGQPSEGVLKLLCWLLKLKELEKGRKAATVQLITQ